MCGICGFVGFNDQKLLKRMCDVIIHRGPDDHGTFVDRNISLGNQRLSIIDIKKGHQPIHNEDESIFITYNGEVYNFLQLKQDLENKGHKFYTTTDTEAIVHAYEEYGDSFVERLRGMFAFAIWDSKKKRLLLGRDRLGKKPLYYTFVNGKFLFGSEIKSILQCEEIKRKVDYQALYNFLVFRYIPGELTMFEGIKKLLPGHILIYEKGNFSIKKYWDLSYPENLEEKSEEYYSKQLFELLKESVKMRLMSEVPLGAYLSGGIDSSCVVGLMSTLIEEPVKTFTVTFGEGSLADESNYARIIAEHFNTDHHEFVVKSETAKLLPQIVWHMDEPNGDPAAIPIYLLSESSKKYVTVVLVGEGGDELFAGYQQYKFMLMGNRYKFLPKKLASWVLKRMPIQFLNRFFEYSSALGEEGVNRAAQFLNLIGNNPKAYLSIVSIFTPEEMKQLCSDKVNAINNGPEKLVEPFFVDKNQHLLNQMQLFDIKNWLTHLLIKTDKMTMAKSIEARVPFLDQRFVEFCVTIPPNLRLKGMRDKYLLRKTMSKLIPKTIMKRKKHQFFVPIDVWFERDLKDIINQLLSEDEVKKRGYFKYDYMRKIIQHFQKSRLYYSRQLWNLLIFDIWHRIFIESSNLSTKPKIKL